MLIAFASVISLKTTDFSYCNKTVLVVSFTIKTAIALNYLWCNIVVIDTNNTKDQQKHICMHLQAHFDLVQ